MTQSLPTVTEPLQQLYGSEARLCPCANDQLTLIFSQTRPFDLVELEQLLEAVGWSRRPVRSGQEGSWPTVCSKWAFGVMTHGCLAWLDLPAVQAMVSWRPRSGTWRSILCIKAPAWEVR